MQEILIVGAGLAGAVYARQLADAGYSVRVIDRRPHIAGNCYDFVDDFGTRIHKYGPHLFHTSNMEVVDWFSRFTKWIPYVHRVVGRMPSGDLVPLPVNLSTVNLVFGLNLSTSDEIARHLASVAVPVDEISTAEDYLFSTIGPDLTNLFYRPYTRKMWGLDLGEVDASVVRRLKIRTDRDDRYFPDDKFQAVPENGYSAAISNILDSRNISIELSTEFDKSMLSNFQYCFNSMPIDQFFDYTLGELDYRSIRFHTISASRNSAPKHTTINYTDNGPYTRETWWHNIPGHSVGTFETVSYTVEEPCDYRDNDMERYYPIKTPDGRYESLYNSYKDLAMREDGMTFIGRCGTYQYLDMHQVINQSLIGVHKWLRARA